MAQHGKAGSLEWRNRSLQRHMVVGPGHDTDRVGTTQMPSTLEAKLLHGFAVLAYGQVNTHIAKGITEMSSLQDQ
jgi:hypothetical protein